MLAPYWPEFLALAVVHFLAVLSPGPDFAIAVRQTVRFGRRSGIYTALGVGAGVSVHVVYTIIGVGALLHATPGLMSVAKWVGAGYIFYLGLRFLGSKPGTGGGTIDAGMPSVEPQRPGTSFAVGFMANALNPKATLFFLAVFTTIVSAQTPPVVQALYGVWMCGVNAAWFVLVSVALSTETMRLRFQRNGHWFERLMGVLLVAFAVRLISSA